MEIEKIIGQTSYQIRRFYGREAVSELLVQRMTEGGEEASFDETRTGTV